MNPTTTPSSYKPVNTNPIREDMGPGSTPQATEIPIPPPPLKDPVRADMMLVERTTAPKVIGWKRDVYVYGSLSALWGLPYFQLGKKGGPRYVLSDDQRVFEITPAVTYLSRLCTQLYTAFMIKAKQELEGLPFQVDEECARLSAVKVWALACYEYRGETDKGVLAQATANVSREIHGIFHHILTRVSVLNERAGAIATMVDYQFMKSEFKIWRIPEESRYQAE